MCRNVSEVPALQGDELTTALIPVADRLISAVHAVDPEAVAQLLEEATQLAGDGFAATRHLIVLLAAMCIEDQSADAVLAWTHDPARYADLRDEGVPALLASLRSARIAGAEAMRETTP